MRIEYRNLTGDDYTAWVRFVTQAYGPNHILSDWSHLGWLLHQAPDCKKDTYDTLIAVTTEGDIVGSYGAMPAKLTVAKQTYSFCWYVNGMVLPKYRNQGIGQRFIDLLLDQFEINGVIGFNPSVKRNYARYNFNFFEDRTLRRFIKVLNHNAYDLVAKIGQSPQQAQDVVAISSKLPTPDRSIATLSHFGPSVVNVMDTMAGQVPVLIHRTAPYLNWRYFMNPRLEYEVTAIAVGGDLAAYLVARHERFAPTNIYGTRLLDLAGPPEHTVRLLGNKVVAAAAQGDAFIEFMLAGHIHQEPLSDLAFTELLGQSYELWPLVSSPIEYRQNQEFICLASRKHPTLLNGYGFNSIYFTRGDSDRDRAT